MIWLAILIGFLIGIIPWVPLIHIKQYRWQQRMRVTYPDLYRNTTSAPKWWQVRRVWDYEDGVIDFVKQGKSK